MPMPGYRNMSVPDRIGDKIDAIAAAEGRHKYAVVERALDLYVESESALK